MNNLFIIFVALFSFQLNSCDQAVYNNKSNCMNGPLISNVPVNRTDSNSIKIRNRIELLAGLSKIDTGFNGLQIRIDYAYSTDIEHLIILTNENKNWSGTLNTLKFNYESHSDNLISINRITQEVVPKSGWKIFTDSLISMGILNLPDMSAIPGDEYGADGTWLTVDFAKCRKYRYYSYQTPWGHTNEFWQAKKIVDISNLIEQELNFTRYSKKQAN